MKSSSVPPILSFLQDLKLPRHALLSACGLRSGVQAFDVLGGAAGVGGVPRSLAGEAVTSLHATVDGAGVGPARHRR